LIESQINADPGLNFDAANGPVMAPALLWGPYIWAAGLSPNADGLVWLATDFEADNVHPSDQGEAKVGARLAAFFDTEVSARAWIDPEPGDCLRAVDAVADAAVDMSAPNQNAGAVNTLDVMGGGSVRRAYLRFSLPTLGGPLLRAQMVVRNLDQAGPKLYSVPDTGWDEATLSWANAPPLGALLSGISSWTRENAPNFDVTSSVQATMGGASGFALEAANSNLQRYASREGLVTPRLLLRYACSDDLYADGFEP